MVRAMTNQFPADAFDLLAPNAPISLAFFASQCQHLRDALR